MRATKSVALFLLIPALSVLNGAQSALEQARALITRGEYRGARTLLAPLDSQNPASWEPHYLLGLACFRLEDSVKAVSQFQAASEKKPGDPQILKLLSRSSIAADLKPKAEETLLQLTRLAPGDYEAWSLLGRLCMDGNRFTEAAGLLQKALELNPNDVMSWTRPAVHCPGCSLHFKYAQR